MNNSFFKGIPKNQGQKFVDKGRKFPVWNMVYPMNYYIF